MRGYHLHKIEEAQEAYFCRDRRREGSSRGISSVETLSGKMSECVSTKMEEYSWSEFGEGTLPRTKVTREVKNVSNSYVKKMTLVFMPR